MTQRRRLGIDELLDCLDVLNASSAEGDFTEFVCPECGSALRLCFHPRGNFYALWCVREFSHFSVNRPMSEPPSWWSKYADGEQWVEWDFS
jgi:hypothetical protein